MIKTCQVNPTINGQVRKKQKQCVKQDSCKQIICDLEQRISKSLEQQKLINQTLAHEIKILSNHVSQFQQDANLQTNRRKLINNQQQLNNDVKSKRKEEGKGRKVNISKLIQSVQIEAPLPVEHHQAIDHSVGNTTPDYSCIRQIYSNVQISDQGSTDRKEDVNESNKSTYINSKMDNVTQGNMVCSANENIEKQGNRKLKDQILSKGLPSSAKSSKNINYININNVKIAKSITNEIKSDNKNKIPFRFKHKG